MTKNVPKYAPTEDEEFDLVDVTDAATASQQQQQPPPTSATQSSNLNRLPLSPSQNSDPAPVVMSSVEVEKWVPERDPNVPPVPPKPSNYVSQIDAISDRLTETNLEDSFISAGNVSDSGYSNYGYDHLYAGGKRIYKSLKSHMHMDWGREKEVLIAVMGMTGSGKTTFISKVTGRDDLKIGHDLTSCTQEISVYETRIDDTVVRFVDTPGFSDTYLSDTEVLEMIADYLAAAYTKDVKLNGIIYLHPISDRRVTHHATKNLEMFRKLTGEGNLKNVLLATSMWDKVTAEEGAKRERELREKFWKVLIALGARPVRYRGTQDSARDLSTMLMENKPFYLQLQEEMGKGNKALKDTSAGREIMQELAKMKEQHERELEEMKDIIMRTQEEKNEAAVRALEEHYQGLLRDMEKTMRDERRMNDEAVRSLTERIDALESRGMCVIV
ncbi:hypothetical protein ABW19_dt0203643 [Dactylella cylindrospora]|nr:hypothetical protein ABW19_dt0203643 [Dactylella cylindrospora]